MADKQTSWTALAPCCDCPREFLQAAMESGCCQDVPSEALLDRLSAQDRADPDNLAQKTKPEGTER